ncbi:MAG: trans-aconitate 2-methyltransferase [Dehalococcoidia bacterium]
MPPLFYEQAGLASEIYGQRTSLLPVIRGDARFYGDLAREAGGPILELGCGEGRFLIPFARSGFDITGIDRSKVMLDRARQAVARLEPRDASRITVVHGDMTDFRLQTQFGFVFSAFRSFMFITEPEAQRRCLERVRDHLRPGGILAIDIFDPLLDRMVPDLDTEDWSFQGTVPHPDSFNLVLIQAISRANDPLSQVFEETWRYSEHDREGNQLRQEEEVLRMRWTYRYEMRYLLELAGFEVVAEYSDYLKSPPAYGKEQIWVARKP